MNRWRVRVIALALLCALLCPVAAAAADLTYLVHAPAEPSAHPPLIVLLHGAGADERDMIGMWRDLPQNFVVISPRAPFGGGGGYRWYRKTGASPRAGDLEISAKIVDLVVDNAAKRFDADPKRLFLGGFSQGAVMTYEVALREPGRFRGAAVLSGSLFSSEAVKLSPHRGSHPRVFLHRARHCRPAYSLRRRDGGAGDAHATGRADGVSRLCRDETRNRSRRDARFEGVAEGAQLALGTLSGAALRSEARGTDRPDPSLDLGGVRFVHIEEMGHRRLHGRHAGGIEGHRDLAVKTFRKGLSQYSTTS